MSMNAEYKKVKNKGRLLGLLYFILGLGVTAVYIWLLNILWNYVALDLGLVRLSYTKFGALMLLAILTKALFSQIIKKR